MSFCIIVVVMFIAQIFFSNHVPEFGLEVTSSRGVSKTAAGRSRHTVKICAQTHKHTRTHTAGTGGATPAGCRDLVNTVYTTI